MERNGKGVNGNGRKPTPDPSLKGREQEVSPLRGRLRGGQLLNSQTKN
jgi:hypothetical protein